MLKVFKQEEKLNGKRCDDLVQRVKGLEELVIRQKGSGQNPAPVERALAELKITLESAKKLISRYTWSSPFRRMRKAFSLGGDFVDINERLDDAGRSLASQLLMDQIRAFSCMLIREKEMRVLREKTAEETRAMQERIVGSEDARVLREGIAEVTRAMQERIVGLHQSEAARVLWEEAAELRRKELRALRELIAQQHREEVRALREETAEQQVYIVALQGQLAALQQENQQRERARTI